MKISTVMSTIGLAAALITPAMAQSGVNVSVNVPHAFRVGAQSLPAGQYTFKANGGSGLMTVQDVEGKHCAMTVTSLGDEAKAAEPQVVFRSYGAVHYLAGVWGSNSNGRALAMSASERGSAGIQTASLHTLLATSSR